METPSSPIGRESGSQLLPLLGGRGKETAQFVVSSDKVSTAVAYQRSANSTSPSKASIGGDEPCGGVICCHLKVNGRSRETDEDNNISLVRVGRSSTPRFEENWPRVINSGVQEWSSWCDSMPRQLTHQLLCGHGSLPCAWDATKDVRSDDMAPAEQPDRSTDCRA